MDIFAVVPFYVLPGIDAGDNAAIELLVLLVPILRLLKITRHSSGWRLLIISIQESIPQLMVPFFLLLLMVVFSSCVIFWIEKHTASLDDGAAFESIPHAMWFAIVTVSTVGYGDVSPNSDIAKLGSTVLILVGICYMAMPLAIVGNTFTQVWTDRDKILIAEKTQRQFAHGGISSELLHELFEETDAYGSGNLSRREFVKLIIAFNIGFTVPQINRLFRALDGDGSG